MDFVKFIWIIFVLMSWAVGVSCASEEQEDLGEPCLRVNESIPYESVLIVQTDNIVVLNSEYAYTVDDLLKNNLGTVTISHQTSFVSSIYNFLCSGVFEVGDLNGFHSGMNYVGVFFSADWLEFEGYKSAEYAEIFSISKRNLYAGGGHHVRRISDDFVGRFNFSDGSLDIVGYK